MSLAIIRSMEFQATHYSNWHDTALPGLTREQKYWLLRPGALTAGLRQIGRGKLPIIKEYSSGLSPQEAWMLGRAPRSPIRSEEHTSEPQSLMRIWNPVFCLKQKKTT